MRAVALVAAVCHAFTTPTTLVHRHRVSPAGFLSPAMSGFIQKTLNSDEYESIVAETMTREQCSREEAVERYNNYLYDPNGYALVKMQEQLKERGYSTFEEMFITEYGQDAWDERQATIEENQKKRQKIAIAVVSVLFTAFVIYQEYLKAHPPMLS